MAEQIPEQIPSRADGPGRPARLLRTRGDRVIAGVCGGLGVYLGIDPTLVRIATVVMALATGGAVVVGYIVACIVVPEDDGTRRYTGSAVGGDQGRLIAGAVLVVLGILWSVGALLPGLLELRVLAPLALIVIGAVLLAGGMRR